MPERPDAPRSDSPEREPSPENAPPSFDVVVATVGRTTELSRLLESLQAQACPLRLIVVDQNADERIVPVLARHAEHVHLIRLRSPKGLSRARNVGLREVRATVVAFADDDCWYPPDFFARIGGLLGAHPDWGGVTGRVVDPSGHPSAARWSRHAGPVDRRNVWTRGVSISTFLRREVVERVGDFDESLGVGSGTVWGSGEETDYLLRAVAKGVVIWYDPGLAVFHPPIGRHLTPEAIGVGRRYGAGMGRVLRIHHYPWWFAGYHIGRAFGGAALALARGRVAEARFHLAVALGRLQGWRSGERDRNE